MRVTTPTTPHRPHAAAAAGSSSDEPMMDTSTTAVRAAVGIIRADLVIPGRGEPIKDGAVVIRGGGEGGRIAWVGAFDDLPPEYRSVSDGDGDGDGASIPLLLFSHHVPVLMPGLWDCHAHFSAIGRPWRADSNSAMMLPGAEALTGAVTVADLRRTLEAGFTSVRELSGYAGYLSPGIRDGYIIGPNVYSSLTALSITGGHGDLQDCSLHAVLGYQHAGGQVQLCDGVDDCTKAVRSVVRRGAKCIKVCSSGGVLSLNDDPEDRQFSDAELKAVVDEASRSGRAVAAHAIGKAGILAALRAGVKSIEHGCYLDEEVADLMKEKGAILVATRHIQESLLADPHEFPPQIREKIKKLVPLTRSNYRLAVQLGVRIALGTDSFSSNPEHPISHGKNAMELHHAANAGMSPLQIIEACTATPPEVLGKHAPQAGQLREGYDADMIAVASNPLDNIDILTNPENITHVWKGGKLLVYKS